MSKARIEILGDSSSYQRAVKEAAVVTDKLGGDMKKLAVTAQSSADAQVKASLRKDARLREEIVSYKRIAAAAEHGSREQVVAANLAAQAEAKLGRSLGVVAGEQAAVARGAARAERDIGRATRGALAGSGVFRSFGRSIAFASGGFLAFAGVGQFLRTSIDAAREGVVSEKQLAAQLKASGKSYRDYRGEINQTNLRLGALAGFQNDELNASFTTIFRASRNVQKTLRDEALAANIARARHISLAAASVIVGKVEAGNVGILRRAGVQIAKNATVEEALATARKRFAGQAKAGTTDQERFGAVLHDTEEIIGGGLLPSLNQLQASVTKYLSQSKNQEKIQRDVNSAVKTTKEILGDVKDVLSPLVSAFKLLGKATGGTENEIKLLGTAFLIFEARARLVKWGLIATGVETVGTEAAVSSGKVSALAGSLGKLKALGIVTVGVEILIHRKDIGDKVGDIFRGLTGSKKLGDIANFLERAGIDAANPPTAAKDIVDAVRGRQRNTPTTKQQTGLNPATRGFVQSTPTNVSGELKFGDPTTAARTLLNQTFAEAKALNPKITRKTFDLGQQVARAYILGLNKKTAEKATLPTPTTNKGLSLKGQFNVAELKLANAQLTKTSADDRAILLTEAAIVRQQVAGAKKLKDRIQLTQQLAGILGQIQGIDDATVASEKQAASAAKDRAKATRERAKAAREHTLAVLQARQFRVLGLDASGSPLTPGVKSLKHELGSVSDAVAGTFLDTNKTKSVLAKIRRVLSGGLGALSKDVRSTVKQMLDDLDQQLKDHSGPETRFKAVSTNQILAGLGLNPAQTREARARLSQLGTGGTVPATSHAAHNTAQIATTVIHTHFMLDGREVAVNTTKHQQKAGRRNPPQKRGAFAGGGR